MPCDPTNASTLGASSSVELDTLGASSSIEFQGTLVLYALLSSKAPWVLQIMLFCVVI